MNKKNFQEGTRRVFIFLAVLFAFFLIYSVLANTTVLPSAFYVNEDLTNLFNITVNNTATTSTNITQVNITVPSGFTFTNGNGSAASSVFAFFANTSSVLSWLNDTAGANLILNNTWRYFWFNTSAATPGIYNITITTLYNGGGVNMTNISVTVNDTTMPSVIINQPQNQTYRTNNSLSLNYTVSDNGVLSTCWYSIDAGANVTIACGTNSSINVSDGASHTVRAYANDSYNNINGSATVTFFVDSLLPTALDFQGATPANGVNQTATSITFNVTASESFIGTALLQIANGNSFNNYTMTCTTSGASNSCNYTNATIADGRYNYTAFVNDTAGNINATLTRSILVDSVFPLIDYGGNVLANYVNASQSNVYFNASITETNFKNITFTLANMSGTVINTTILGGSTRSLNITGLTDGNYTYNISTFDEAGNLNITVNRAIILDTIFPVVIVNQPQNRSYATNTSISLNATLSDAAPSSALHTCWYGIDGGANVTIACGTNTSINVSNEAQHTIRFYSNDSANNVNGSASTTLIADSLFPRAIDFQGATPAASVNQTATSITFNITVTEGFIRTAFLQLAIASSFNNYTMTCTTSGASNSCNYTNATIADGRYNYTAFINDSSGNLNNSVTRALLVDSIFPLLDYGSAVVASATNLSQSNIFLNASLTETNFKNITFTLANMSGTVVNTTISSDTTRSLNITGLTDGNYTYNISTFDEAGNLNITATRTITLDTTRPLVSYGSVTQGDAANVSQSNVFINITVTETNEANVTFKLFNSTTTVNQTTLAGGQRTINITSLADGVYTYNATVTDAANNQNVTITRTITLDTSRPLLSYGAVTFGAYVNVSQPSIFVNISATETNVKNTTFALMNDTAIINVTFYATPIYNINFTGLVDGNYSYNASIFDTSGNFNTTANRVVIIDATRPLIDYGVVTQGNYANVSANAIFVNVSVTETNEANVTFVLANRSGTVINTTFLAAGQRNINFTGLADGNYTYNVTVSDFANNMNFTATRMIVLDRTAPSVGLSLSSSTSDTLTIAAGIGEETSGVNGTCTVSRGTASVSGSGLGQTVTESSLSCSTGYSYTVTCRDYAGNSGSGGGSFSTSSCTGGPGSGGSSSGTTPTVWARDYIASSAQLSEGYNRVVGTKERVKMTVESKDHHVGVLNITGQRALIEVASVPQQVTMNVGETKQFEVSDDKYYDLNVTLNSISSSKANVTILVVHELMSVQAQQAAQNAAATTSETSESGSESQQQESAPQLPAKKRAFIVQYWWLVLILVLLIAAVVFVFVKLMKKQNAHLRTHLYHHH